ncbi:hypothetical protein J3R83DRAFT_5941 [Lanmaoa asiatica]|nr:hypothetical protein J3R83DRAFT_5941 [Lanmaoa asiatica]
MFPRKSYRMRIRTRVGMRRGTSLVSMTKALQNGTEQDENAQLQGMRRMRGMKCIYPTQYLFNDDKAMMPLGQMQTMTAPTIFIEVQRIAFAGLCALTTKEMVQKQKNVPRKELKGCYP